MDSVSTDKVFSALADANRRRIIEILYEEDKTIQDILESFEFSFQALSKHVKILENAGILAKRKKGKYVVCSLNHVALLHSVKWISYHANFWHESFDKLDALIEKDNAAE